MARTRKGRYNFPIVAMLAEGCPLTQMGLVFQYIHTSMDGDPCTTGCMYFKSGKCSHFKRLRGNDLSKAAPELVVGNNIGMFSLVTTLSGENNIQPLVFVAALIVAASDDPLDPPHEDKMWERLKERFPDEGGQYLDSAALVAKVKEVIAGNPAMTDLAPVR